MLRVTLLATALAFSAAPFAAADGQSVLVYDDSQNHTAVFACDALGLAPAVAQTPVEFLAQLASNPAWDAIVVDTNDPLPPDLGDMLVPFLQNGTTNVITACAVPQSLSPGFRSAAGILDVAPLPFDPREIICLAVFPGWFDSLQSIVEPGTLPAFPNSIAVEHGFTVAPNGLAAGGFVGGPPDLVAMVRSPNGASLTCSLGFDSIFFPEAQLSIQQWLTDLLVLPPVCQAVANVAAQVVSQGPTQDVEITWDPQDAYVEYRIIRHAELIAFIDLIGGPIGLFVDQGVTPGVHSYTVEAVCTDGTVTANGTVIDTRPRFIRADANGDGLLDIADAITGLSVLFSGATATCSSALDANDDGMVDIGDPISLLGFIFSMGPAPAAPFPECGVDPTPDAIGCGSYGACP